MTDDPRILVRKVGSSEGWTTPETSAYDNEAHLQALLVQDPSRVPGISREAKGVDELSTSGGPIDVSIVDLDGSITVIECKLASNSEKRRMVIGQVVDYASAIWAGGATSFLAAWHHRGGVDLSEMLRAEAFDALNSNIAEARINLCLAVDSIDDDLRRLVEYLNHVTRESVRVTALQLAYARHGELEMLIPSTFGGELAAAKARVPKDPWTREAFLDAIASAEDQSLADWYLGQVEALRGQRGPSEVLGYGIRPGGGIFLHPYGLRYAPVQLSVSANGRLMLFGNWKNWSAIMAHEGFVGLAALFGQDHRGGSRGVPAASFDRSAVWAEVLRCAEAINQADV